MELHQQIEGVLFYKGAPVKKSELCTLFACESHVLDDTLTTLAKRLQAGALRLIQTDAEVQLATAPELDETIEIIRKDEMRRDIGKAGAETLAIILYKAPITRAQIDRIRGVNSSFILRNLMVRGLIERNNIDNGKTFVITPALLAHLGVTRAMDLPDYATVLDQLEKFETQQEQEDNV